LMFFKGHSIFVTQYLIRSARTFGWGVQENTRLWRMIRE